ncbi:MAG TPA: aminoacetone oxidase family FAD-binding enzyme, partial [Bacteroidales bacterium]
MDKYDVVVIGAGAAGLLAAGRAAELGGKVLLLEKMERAGRKLLITGKGRCNITNEASMSDFFKHIYPNGRFLKHAFSVFFTNDIIDLLRRFGVETNVERGGRFFPKSDRSADVVQALVKWALYHKVEIHYGAKAEKLIVNDGVIHGVEVSIEGLFKKVFAENVIICTGGCSYPATGSTGDGYKFAKEAGHSVEHAMPALVPIETAGNLAERLQGLSLKNVNAVVWINGKKQKEEFGEMLFTHFGLSGPIILTLSRFIVSELHKNSKVEVSIDLKPALDEQKLDTRLIRDLNDHGKKKIDNIFKEWL